MILLQVLFYEPNCGHQVQLEYSNLSDQCLLLAKKFISWNLR